MTSPRREIAAPENLAPGPQTLNQTEVRFDYYKALIERNGGTFDAGANKKNLVAIRSETNVNANGGQGVYDDTAVLLWLDDSGRKHVSQYRANTEPVARYINNESETRDVNNDGQRELGRLPAGSYYYVHNWFKNKHDTVGDGNVFTMLEGTQRNAEYDTNHDGFFNDNALGPGGETMFWHGGRAEDVASAGCQTMHPDDWSRFIDDMGVSVVDKYNPLSDQIDLRYTLINEDRSKGNVAYGPADARTVSSGVQLAATAGSMDLNLRIASGLAFAAGTVNSFLAAALGRTFADGGDVKGPGSSIGDKIPAYLSDGEFIMNARSTAVNRPFLQALNADPQFLQKMLAARSAGSGSGGGSSVAPAPGGQNATVNISMSSSEDIVSRLKVLSAQWELLNAK